MKIKLPLNINHKEEHVDTQCLVVIGTNGIGKSSVGKMIASQYPDKSTIISGLHALFISTQPGDKKDDEGWLQLQTLIKERLLLPRITDYEKLIVQLQQEEFEIAVNYKESCKKEEGLQPPVTKLDLIQTVWEEMFPHNRLVRKSGFFEVASTYHRSLSYNAGRMSDSEKLVFYLIGAVLFAPSRSLLIIEEPETLLHDSIKNLLWDRIEQLRPDCTYIYLTHDIDFALSRRSCKRLWIRDFDADNKIWDYQVIENSTSLPEEVYMEVLGNRKPVLFVEGTENNSIDIRLYSLVFPDHMVKPMGGCQKVIETTKAFNQMKEFHTLDSFGIVDRDRRTENEIEYLNRQHIFVPDVAEVENLLMLEEIIKTVATKLRRNPDTVFEKVKKNVIQLFKNDLEEQIILHTKHKVKKKLESSLNYKIHSFEQLNEHVEEIHERIRVEDVYETIRRRFVSYIETGNYKLILRVYNQKSMLPDSQVCQLCGVHSKDSYLDYILSLLRKNGNEAETIRKAIRDSLGVSK